MLKKLLFASFAFLGVGANAQQYTCEATAESLNALSGSGGVVFAKGDGGTIATAYDDGWRTMPAYGSYKNVRVGNVELTLSDGAVGSTNATFTNYASGVMSAGAVFEITPTKSGWLTLFAKLSLNKQYVVFEGENGPLSYTLGWSNGNEKIHFTLPYYPETYYINFEDYLVGSDDDLDADGNPRSYFVAAGGELGTAEVKPNYLWKIAGMEELSQDQNTGFLTFRVIAGNKYYFSALGSKVPCGAFVLTEGDEMPTVKFLATDTLPEVTFVPDNSGSGENPGDEPGAEPDPNRLTTEATAASLEAIGIDVNNTDSYKSLPSGTIFAKGAAGTIATAYDLSWQATKAHGAYQNVKVGDVELNLSYGLRGDYNPSFVNYANGAPSAGAVFEITPTKSGWVTLFTNLNSHKQYVVFEGKTNPMSYTLGWSDGEDKIHYTLPYDPETYYIDFYAEDASKYFVPAGGDGPEDVKPQFPSDVAGWDDDWHHTSTGFLTFRVSAGQTYYFAALGSRAPLGAFVLTEGDEEPTVTFLATEYLPEVTFVPDKAGSGEEPGEEPGDNWDPNRLTAEATAASLRAIGIDVNNTDSYTSLPAGTIIAEGGAGTITVAYDEHYKAFKPCGSYRTVMVGDVELYLSYGVTGQSNPAFVTYAEGVMYDGTVYEITPAKNGWVTVFTKMNPNKQYVVFEGKTTPLSYTLGYANGTDKIYYTLPYDPKTYAINFEDYIVPGHELEYYEDETPKYTYFAAGELGTDMVRPNYPWKVVGMPEKLETQETGFLTFNVVAGMHYYFAALGSKAPVGSFVLTEGDEMPTVKFLATDTLPEVTFEPIVDDNEMTQIENLEMTLDNGDAPIYNVMGLKVGPNAKGILIQNGKKLILR